MNLSFFKSLLPLSLMLWAVGLIAVGVLLGWPVAGASFGGAAAYLLALACHAALARPGRFNRGGSFVVRYGLGLLLKWLVAAALLTLAMAYSSHTVAVLAGFVIALFFSTFALLKSH